MRHHNHPIAIALIVALCALTLMGPENEAIAQNSRAMTGVGKWKKKCPVLPPKPLVYGIGSSTMGTSLGKLLSRNLKALNLPFRKWGVASSGLARPDFHDWPNQMQKLVKERNPKIFVISLGTNDFQALYKAKRKWVTIKEEAAWKKLYSERIDHMLEETSGRDRKRMVIWIAPTIFGSKKARKVGRWVHDLLEERIQAFGGPVFLVDAYAATTHQGQPREFYEGPDGKKHRIYGKDKIHLKVRAVEDLMMRPVLDLIRPCVPAPAPTASP